MRIFELGFYAQYFFCGYLIFYRVLQFFSEVQINTYNVAEDTKWIRNLLSRLRFLYGLVSKLYGDLY